MGTLAPACFAKLRQNGGTILEQPSRQITLIKVTVGQTSTVLIFDEVYSRKCPVAKFATSGKVENRGIKPYPH